MIAPNALSKLSRKVKKLDEGNASSLSDAEANKALLAPYSSYRNDPVGFASDILGDTLTAPQVAIANRILTDRVIPVPAAHGVGKSFLASRLVLWAVYARQQLAITTAPTRRQVEQILWSEIRRLLGSKELPGERGITFVRVAEWARAFGFTATTSGVAGDSAFQGIHSPNGVLIVIDEANGVHPNVLDGAISCLSGVEDRILLIGNPTSSGTPFEAICKKFEPTRISAWSHPNVSRYYLKGADGIHRLRPEFSDALPQEYPVAGAITCQWIEEVRHTKGDDSPYWQGRVEARFPEVNNASIIPRAWLEEAYAKPSKAVSKTPVRWGVDVGDGGDSHAIAAFRGDTLIHLEELRGRGDGRDTDHLVTRLIELCHKNHRVSVDVTGVGTGTASQLLSRGYAVERRHFGAGAKDRAAYANWVTETAWTLREAFRDGCISVDQSTVSGDLYTRLQREFTATQYKELPSGKIALESKDLVKSKLKGESPNLRDAVLLAWGASRRRVIGNQLSSLPRQITSDLDRF